MNKQQLAAKIWASANKMRSKIEANEYKDYILGFIFYKFLSDKEVGHLKNNGISDEELKTITEDNTEAVDFIQQEIGYFISYENLFSTWTIEGGVHGFSHSSLEHDLPPVLPLLKASLPGFEYFQWLLTSQDSLIHC